MWRHLLFFVLTLTFKLSHAVGPQDNPGKDLLSGWELWDPYQYEVLDNGVNELTGLDVALGNAILKAIDHTIVYEPVSWKQHLLDLKDGKRILAAGATYTDDRTQYVYFSKPYRFEENSLFVRRGQETTLSFQTIDQFLEEVEHKKFRLAVEEGVVYADPKINEWLKRPEIQPLILRVATDNDSVDALIKGKVDGFLADRLVGATIIWRKNLGKKINEIRLNIKTPIHFMFSKKRVTPAFIDKVNGAIDSIKKTAEYDEIVRFYLYPVLLLQTFSADWYRIIDIIGIIAFALSGIVLAYRENATLFGAFLYAFLPSLGGGIIRDLMFARKPIAALQSPLYLFLIMATVIIGFLSIRLYEHLQRKSGTFLSPKKMLLGRHVLVVTDAIGLASFTVTGVIIAVLAKTTPLWLWGPFFAFLTGAGGGILRDMLSKARDIVSMRDIYPEIAILWGFLLAIFLIYQSSSVDADPIEYAVIATVIGAFLTRILLFIMNTPNIHMRARNTEENLAK